MAVLEIVWPSASAMRAGSKMNPRRLPNDFSIVTSPRA
jgi:hypothetical protein